MRRMSIVSSLLLLASWAYADTAAPLFEIKPGYFFFADSPMRKIYNHGGFEIQASGSYPVWKWLEVYGSIGYLKTEGRSLNACEKTSLWEIPVDLGLKPVFTLGKHVDYYFAFGPRYFYVHQHNKSAYVNNNLHRNGIGLFVNTGFNIVPADHFFIGIFGEYSYEPTSFCSSCLNVYGQNVQVGGFTFGASLGYAF